MKKKKRKGKKEGCYADCSFCDPAPTYARAEGREKKKGRGEKRVNKLYIRTRPTKK